jgi:hypothetical protein
MRRIIVISLYLFLSLVCASHGYAAISASVNKAVVKPGQELTLIYQSSKAVKAKPDFSVIEKSFKIIAKRPITFTQIVKGKRVQRTRWELVLKAKKVGEITIPRIRFGNERSPEVVIKVVKRIHDARTFVRVDLKPKTIYVQQHAIITYKVYVDQRYRRLASTYRHRRRRPLIPKILHGDAIFHSLSQNGFKGTPENYKGQTYDVYHYPYVVVPVRPGKLELRSPITRVNLQAKGGLSVRPFVQDIDVDDQTFTILGKPKSFKGKHWLPAQGLRLVDDWSRDPSELKLGEPVTRTIEIQAQGLSKDQLPKLDFGAIKGVKQYFDTPKLENEIRSKSIIGTRREIISFIPTKAGKLEIPEIKLMWWNTQSKKFVTAIIPKRTIKVVGSATGVSLPATHIKPPKTHVDPARTGKKSGKASSQPGLSGNLWFWITLVLVVVWVGTVVLLMLRRKPKKQTAPQADETAEQEDSRDSTITAVGAPRYDPKTWNDIGHWLKLMRSGARSNKGQDARRALLHWGRCRWPDNPPHSIRDIGHRMKHEELMAEIVFMDQCLYDHEKSRAKNSDLVWDGKSFVRVFDDALEKLNAREGVKEEEVLVPLYLDFKPKKAH